MYLTKRWIGRWWWYKHTNTQLPTHSFKIGRFWVGQVSYKISNQKENIDLHNSGAD